MSIFFNGYIVILNLSVGIMSIISGSGQICNVGKILLDGVYIYLLFGIVVSVGVYVYIVGIGVYMYFVVIGLYGYIIIVNVVGNVENIVKNIVFNYIVRFV